jgi:hypothetical protein
VSCLFNTRLLKHEVDSARLTTDSGVELVAYSPISSRAATIQVKTQMKSVAAGGKGAPANGGVATSDGRRELTPLQVPRCGVSGTRV